MSGPLQDIKVLELGSTVAAPFCGRLFADFGAEVIKIEPPSGDTVRTMGRRHEGRSLYAASIFRNKRLLALDLSVEAGRDIVRDLAKRSDIVIENFRPGRMEEWGLGYDALSAENPGLIFVRISGYGQDGPYHERAGYGATCEAVSGLRELTGDPDRPPARVNVSLTDEVAAIYAAFGAMMALHERGRSGRGQVVDAALYEAAFSLIEPHVPAFAKLGVVPTRAGPHLPGSAPNSLYPSADGGWVQITAVSQGTFARLVEQMKKPELMQDERFKNPIARAENCEAMDKIISQWTASLPLMEVEARLIDAGVPAARIYKLPDIIDDPHFRARDMLVELDDDELGSVTVPGVVPKLSRTEGKVEKPGQRVGSDSVAILKEMLGFSDAEIALLIRDGTIKDSR